MSRVKFAVASRRKRKRYLKAAKGFRGGRGRLIRTVKETVEKGWAYAFRDRRVKKRDFRSLWIVRINAATRMNGLTYSKLAVNDPIAFSKVAEMAKQHKK